MRGFTFSKNYTSEERLQKKIYFYVGIDIVQVFFLSIHVLLFFVLISVIILTPVIITTNHTTSIIFLISKHEVGLQKIANGSTHCQVQVNTHDIAGPIREASLSKWGVIRYIYPLHCYLIPLNFYNNENKYYTLGTFLMIKKIVKRGKIDTPKIGCYSILDAGIP